MTIRNLEHMLAPDSVALIGASAEAGSVGAWLARNLAAGFEGRLDFVNPKGGRIEGRTVYRSIAELPAPPSLAVISTPAATVPGIIAELGRRGTRAVVVITAGIKGELRQAMLDAARPHCLRVLGPNCIGLMLPERGVNASFSHIAAPRGDLAFLSQSGALVTGILDWAASRDIGFSHVVSLGDMADVDFGDMLDYLAGDTESRAILVYMEALTHARKFMSAARRAARSKPVIIIKSGRHAAGARAATSHTGALAGLDAAYDAAFRRAGLLRVFELEDLFNAAEVLSRMPRIYGERLTIVTNGGGAGVLATDRVVDLKGALAELSRETIARLDEALPGTWSRANPIDIIGDAGPERYGAAVEAALGDPATDAVLVINCPTAVASSTEAAKAVIAARDRDKESRGRAKPLVTNWLGQSGADDARHLFAAAGIPSFETPGSAVEGFMHLVAHARAQKQLMRAPPSRSIGREPDRAGAHAIIARVLASGRTLLSELEAKELLACYAIPTVPTRFAPSPAAVRAAAADIVPEHGAVVVKILSEDITHKSDVGGVALNLDSPEAAETAAASMLARLAKSHPDARIAGFTVQAMVRRRLAHELIIGVSEDQTFGPLVMFGAGGTSVEVVRDTCLALPPLDLKLAEDLIARTRVSRLLQGYRDRPAADLDAICDTLVKISQLVSDHAEVRELDINPLIADDNGVIALDARVRVADEAAEPRRPMALRPYPIEWERLIRLPEIGPVLIRPIRPEDEHLYARFFKDVTAADSRMRFFSPMKGLTHEFIARLTQVDYAREIAFVALSDIGELLGVARFNADPDYETAEYGILIRSDLKGRGLGRRLMQHLIDYGRAEGLKRIIGYVLAENAGMLGLAISLGFTSTTPDDDPTLRRVVIELTGKPG
ncbi:MAG: bifunctional acetate--CoA ligase family protein/GNAT family N-acetyltransferase [Hyphomicrobiaceae bacterium]|nr:bifunctional acetate--CoA ligase family protein/GNAT family N-acetyltransferase [Hyphomicrobiaceae bacterium]